MCDKQAIHTTTITHHWRHILNCDLVDKLDIVVIFFFGEFVFEYNFNKMSARVLNPLFISELYKKSPKVRCHMPSANHLAKVKRDLFGPVDREDCKR